MMFWIFRFCLVAILATPAVPGFAATCIPTDVPANGATADADLLNNYLACLAPLSSPNFTGSVGVGTVSPPTYLSVSGDSGAIADNAVASLASTSATAGAFVDLISLRANTTLAASGGYSLFAPANGGGTAMAGELGLQSMSTGAHARYVLGDLVFQVSDGTSSNVGNLVGIKETYYGFTGIGVGAATGAHFGSLNHGYFNVVDPAYPLEVAGDGSDGYFAVTDAIAASATHGGIFIINGSGNIGVGTTSPTMTFQVDRTAGGTSAWTNTSDARLKKNIVPITNAVALIEQLQGVRFDWRKPDEREFGKNLKLPVSDRQVGFIAQNLKKILPEAVTVSRDPERLMGVQETKVVPVLVEAVKQLVAMNKAQTSRIQKLERRVSVLERRVPTRTAANQIPMR